MENVLEKELHSRKEANPSTLTATAQISTPAPNDINSDNDVFLHVFHEMQNATDEFGYNGNVAGFSIDRVVT